MKVDFIIVGQGIAGTLISFELMRHGKSVLVIDQLKSDSSSLIAGAVLNPVVFKGRKNDPERTGQIKIAVDVYEAISKQIQISFLKKTTLIRFADSAEELSAFRENISKAGVEKEMNSDISKEIEKYFIDSQSSVSVSPVWKVDNGLLLSTWRKFLLQNQLLREEIFEYANCKISKEEVIYKDICSEKIIFCEGVGVKNNPFINSDSFIPNRGDVLILFIPGLQTEIIFQKEYRLIPMNDELFWLGSNYRWSFENLKPDAEWRINAEPLLKQWIKLPFKVEHHLVAERPTTSGQQVFATNISGYKNAFWLNGLGTRGFTIAPAIIQSWLPRLLH